MIGVRVGFGLETVLDGFEDSGIASGILHDWDFLHDFWETLERMSH